MSENELKEIFSYNLNFYLEKEGRTQLELAKYVGVSNTTVNNWSKGYNTPRMDKVDRICQFFGIKRSDLLERKASSDDKKAYYFNPETAEIAQQIYDDPELRVLFDAARGSKPNDLQMAADMLKRFKETNPDG